MVRRRVRTPSTCCAISIAVGVVWQCSWRFVNFFAPVQKQSLRTAIERKQSTGVADGGIVDGDPFLELVPKPEFVDDFDDTAIQQFYEETTAGGTGGPIPSGRLRDVFTSYFMWVGRGRNERAVTEDDHRIALQTCQKQMSFVLWRTWGGPKGRTADDGKGWVWLASVPASDGNGVYLQIYTSVPYGTNPILVAKADDVAAMFDNENWAKVESRLDTKLGAEIPGSQRVQEAQPPVERSPRAPAPPAPEVSAPPQAAAEMHASPEAGTVESSPRAPASPAPEMPASPEAGTGTPESDEDRRAAISRMRVPELRERCRTLGIDDTGAKAALIDRLLKAR